jgi:hypothetical protein
MVLEIQAAYITKMVEVMRDEGIPKLEVNRDAAEKYDKWIVSELDKTTWPIVHNYWRKGGTGRIFTHYPGSIARMWWNSAWPVWADYKGAEKLAVRQRIRTILFTLVLIGASALAGTKLWKAQVLQKLVLHALQLGGGIKSRVLQLVA